MKGLARVLWIASVPVAFTVLAAEPRGGHDAEVQVGEHHVVTNPIQNFADFWTYRESDSQRQT